ncbi:MAG: amidase [Alphaproteobacteria bacterium]
MKIEEYLRLDGIGLGLLVKTRQVSAEEVVQVAIDIAEQVEPKISALCWKRFEQALEEAMALDGSDRPSGPFAGVPFAVKELGIMVKDAPLPAGSRLLEGIPQQADSELARRYMKTGVILMGGSKSPEFGISVTTEPEVHGPACNPWNPDYGTGGSSGGAAALVAAGIMPLAHASDGGGSIRIPASHCGIFGFKPTRGMVPIGPERFEGWEGLAGPHVVSRSVRDSAAMLDLTSGPLTGDFYGASHTRQTRLLEAMEKHPGRLRIARMTDHPLGLPLHPDVVAATDKASKLCADLGHEIYDAPLSVDFAGIQQAMVQLVAANLAREADEIQRLTGRVAGPDTLEAFTWDWLQMGREISAPDYLGAVHTLHQTARKIGQFFTQYDVILSPVCATPPPRLGEIHAPAGNLLEFIARLGAHAPFTALFNISGGPAMSVPLHQSEDGLPIGVQFAADQGQEARLFQLACQLDDATAFSQRGPSLWEELA